MRYLKKHLRNFFANSMLKNKIRIIVSLLLILPMLLFMLLFLVKTTRLTMNQTLDAMSISYTNNCAIMNRYFDSMKLTMNNLLVNEEIYRVSDEEDTNIAVSQHQWFINLAAFFTYMQDCSDIDNIHLYVARDYFVPEDEQTLSLFAPIETSPWYLEMRQKQQNRRYLSPADHFSDNDRNSTFSYVSILYSPSDYMKPNGLMRVEIDQSKFRSVLSELTFTPNTLVYISDGNRILIKNQDTTKYISNHYETTDSESYETILVPETRQLQSNYFWNTCIIDKTRFITYTSTIGNSPYTLSIFVPQKEIFQEQASLFTKMVVGFFILCVLAFLLVDLCISRILERIYHLKNEMEKVKAGNFDIDLPVDEKDEIGVLENNFLSMTHRIDEMITEKYELGLAVKNAEFSALQAQINPHFLYNSLDLINCMAIQEGSSNIAGIVNALVAYYRLSLSHGEDIIPIAQEFRHATTYINIQNMRFDQKTLFIYEEKPWFEEYLIPKMTFQPLIENAILHGILESDEEVGLIQVETELTDSIIHIRIHDNGSGMDENQLNSLMSHPRSKGYGISNIDERLKLYFGPDYGLSFASKKGEGTTVKITIPAIKEDLIP